MRYPAALSMVGIALLVGGPAARGDERAAPASAKQFEALKGLAGDWVEIGEDGKPTDRVVSSFRVTSGGSAVQETIFPGGEHEMVTMYHLDGEDLVLTHYCILGNQPRMRAEPAKAGEPIVFKFSGATGLKSSDEQHMDHAKLSILGKDHLKAVWTSCKDGKACHEVTLDLARKQR